MGTRESPDNPMVPDEILELIFSYCTYEDLVLSIQYVSRRWRRVWCTKDLWKYVVYRPFKTMTDLQIVRMLSESPNLRILKLEGECGEIVLRAITEYCPELRVLAVCDFQKLNITFFRNLQEKCKKLECLSTPDYVLADRKVSEIISRIPNLKTLKFAALNSTSVYYINLKPLAQECKSLQHLYFRNLSFSTDELYHLLFMRRETLRTLRTFCCNRKGTCILPLLAKCKPSALNSLTLLSIGRCKDKIASEYFTQLRTVKKLALYACSIVDVNQIKGIFENNNMQQLQKLTIGGSEAYDDSVTNIIIENCPMIHTLALEDCKNITNDSLKHIGKLKFLKDLTLFNLDLSRKGFMYLKDVQGLIYFRYAAVQSYGRLQVEDMRELATLDGLQCLELCMLDLNGFPWDDFVQHMKSLKKFYISRCLISSEDLKRIEIGLPYLRVSVTTYTQVPFFPDPYR